MKDSLQPSLWRTCRALANYRRLRLFQLLDERGETTVSQMAELTGRPISETSQGMRALNARGVFEVRRHWRNVYYQVGADPTLPWTAELISVLSPVLREGEDGILLAFNVLTSFTHYRRQQIICVLDEGRDLAELQKRVGASRPSLRRHLRKLRTRGMVEYKRKLYHRAHPPDPLRKTLMNLAITHG